MPEIGQHVHPYNKTDKQEVQFTIQSPVFDEVDRTLSKLRPALWRACWASKVIPKAKPTNGEHHLHMSVALFEQEKLFYTAIHIGSNITPGITWEMFFYVSKCIR